MPNLTSVTLTNGVPTAGSGTVSTVDAMMADGGIATIGAKADNKSTATDTTAISAMSVWKQISASVQSLVSGMGALGQTTMSASAPVVLASDQPAIKGYYVAVAASQTDSVIQSTTGATGDYLDHVVVIPATTAPGVVTIKDNATALISYPGGGTTALLTLTPFVIYVGAFSRSGAWKITTGANVSILAVGKFS